MSSGGKDFSEIYKALRDLMLASAAGMTVSEDGEEGLVMLAPIPHPFDPNTPLWFGAVKVGKAYVSYHLMPIYMNPMLQAKISPALKKRMQGKSCFNFAKIDPELFAELAALTAAGAEVFSKPLTLPKGERPKRAK